MAGLAFSVLTTGIFLYPLISGLIKPNTAEATIVAITVGSTGIKDNSLGMEGNIPNVAVYAEDGTEIGRAYGSNNQIWDAGSTKFVTINPNAGMHGRQATYLSVATGGKNAICISAVSVAWPDSTTPKAGWQIWGKIARQPLDHSGHTRSLKPVRIPSFNRSVSGLIATTAMG